MQITQITRNRFSRIFRKKQKVSNKRKIGEDREHHTHKIFLRFVNKHEAKNTLWIRRWGPRIFSFSTTSWGE